MTRATIQFLRRGVVVEHALENPMLTLLDYLRLEEKSKGTKEGCNEGDCGACTVAIGSLRDGKLVYQSANACILLMAQVHGKELVTVDDLARDGVLHPVQQAMVDTHASQCGFCTPGFVMSLFALYHQDQKASRAEIVEHLAGNLCRCTGYRPIVEAALKACDGRGHDHWQQQAAQTIQQLKKLADVDIFAGNSEGFAALPASEEKLLNLAAKYPEATIVAGATDVGLWITKQLRVLPKLIFTGNVAALHDIEDHEDYLCMGAAATYSEALQSLANVSPDVGDILRRIGSTQVRNAGTIGGNIANGSPIGDMPPLLIALGATLVLKHMSHERRLPLEDYFISYGKQDRRPGELVWAIEIPKLRSSQKFRAYKISKRFDQDISAVMAAFCFDVADGKIIRTRMAYGGMAATPMRALQAEAALQGADLRRELDWQKAIAALAQDFTPLSDMRASASYRMDIAQNLLRKALLEVAEGVSLRVMAGGT